jgi:hypothetical protein
MSVSQASRTEDRGKEATTPLEPNGRQETAKEPLLSRNPTPPFVWYRKQTDNLVHCLKLCADVCIYTSHAACECHSTQSPTAGWGFVQCWRIAGMIQFLPLTVSLERRGDDGIRSKGCS